MFLCRSLRWAYLTGISLAWCCVVLSPLVRSRLMAVMASLPRVYNPSDGHSVVWRGVIYPSAFLPKIRCCAYRFNCELYVNDTNHDNIGVFKDEQSEDAC